MANIGGLADFELAFDDRRVVAIAGPNGSGKSKLLSCLVSAWTRELPAARDRDNPCQVELVLSFGDSEWDAIEVFGLEGGWPVASRGEDISVTVTRSLVGTAVASEPSEVAVNECLRNVAFLERYPSFDLFYLPPERGFSSSRSGPAFIDLETLLHVNSLKLTRETRQAALHSSGVFEDQEFETYAKALCVAASLPDDEGVVADNTEAKQRWEAFRSAVDRLLSPKRLIGLSSSHPSALRIRLPDGGEHSVSELSSGERQVLTIVSRVFRAGDTSTITIIDEPDVHLHPNLSSQLFDVLEAGSSSQLLLATHSPSILDRVPTEAVCELRHNAQPQFVLSEQERYDVYKRAGFRASELTQSDLLLVTEGDFDAELLSAFTPLLSRSAVRGGGGRKAVFHHVSTLLDYGTPVLGVVDRDVLADEVPGDISDNVHEWAFADIEATMLADQTVLQTMVDSGFVNAGVTLADLEQKLGVLRDSIRENLVAELVQRLVLGAAENQAPSPKGNDALARMRAFLMSETAVSESEFDGFTMRANQMIDGAPSPWTFCRGKYVLGKFTRESTQFRTGSALLLATARSTTAAPSEIQVVVDRIKVVMTSGP